MRRWYRRCDKPLLLTRAELGALVAALGLSLAGAAAHGAGSIHRGSKLPESGPIQRFLLRNGVPIDREIRLAKVSAVIKTRYKVRSVVKIIHPEKLPPEKLPSPAELEEIRKRVRKQLGSGRPIKFGTRLDLLRYNILAGEAIEFHPSEKLGELELFFSKNQSLKIQIGYDMFYIRIGNRDCTFRSPYLRKQLKKILQP